MPPASNKIAIENTINEIAALLESSTNLTQNLLKEINENSKCITELRVQTDILKEKVDHLERIVSSGNGKSITSKLERIDTILIQLKEGLIEQKSISVKESQDRQRDVIRFEVIDNQIKQIQRDVNEQKKDFDDQTNEQKEEQRQKRNANIRFFLLLASAIIGSVGYIITRFFEYVLNINK